MNEEEIVDKMREGDENAFEEIFNSYKERAVRTAYLITGNSSICDDIVQECFIKCFTKINLLKSNISFKSWFFRILTRTAWKYGKKHSKDTYIDDICEIGYEEKGFESCEYEYLYDAIKRLDEKTRTVLVLYYFDGFSVKETARITGCFEGTVKSRLYKAREKLKKLLEERGK